MRKYTKQRNTGGTGKSKKPVNVEGMLASIKKSIQTITANNKAVGLTDKKALDYLTKVESEFADWAVQSKLYAQANNASLEHSSATAVDTVK